VNKKINIAIDGYSSCGKSTLAKALSRELHYAYVDSGAMYRAVTLFALRSGFIQEGKVDEDALISSLPNVYVSFRYNPDLQVSETHLNTQNVEAEIRNPEVARYVSVIAAIPAVRSKLVKLQKRMGESGGVIMDGRDIGTVVWPDAELKLFMTAETEVRAKRRYEEMISQGVSVSYNEILSNIEHRDTIDSSREVGPLKMAEDAVIIDNSALTLDEQFQFALNQVRKVNAGQKAAPLPSRD
jgi:cytidylate kinase